MDKHDVLTFLKPSHTDQIDKTRHAFAGVNGIEQDAFEPREHLDGVEGSGCGKSVSLADIVAIRGDVFAPHRAGRAAELGGGASELEHVLLLAFARRTHTD